MTAAEEPHRSRRWCAPAQCVADWTLHVHTYGVRPWCPGHSHGGLTGMNRNSSRPAVRSAAHLPERCAVRTKAVRLGAYGVHTPALPTTLRPSASRGPSGTHPAGLRRTR
ncbi:hypothetical protein GCM10010515_51070 [Streptomyces fructofermentans]|uniref:Uncharacterized protein n=1 Tax=Streptomyces fructofermentans TaxID=152141 RepID=A0A918KUP7_9ACTN|nr:hypothetical protein GCM10010515_51070 [Streptomyces fructofermentans]